MKKLIVAAALMLCSVSAFASNFRGADQVYLPVAGHLAGSSGTFISDVWIANLTSSIVSVSIIYAPFGATPGVGTEFKDKIELQPFERKEFLDFFQSALGQPTGFGQLIFNGCLKGQSCGAETQDPNTGVSPNFRAISVQSRIYQIPNSRPGETVGQDVPGIPWYHFVSQLQSAPAPTAAGGLDKVFIQGITHTGNAGQAGTFRANFGLINASQYSTTTMVMTLYQGTLNDAGKKGEFQTTLGPLGNIQVGFPQAFPSAALGGNYYVTIEQRNSVPTADAPASCNTGCPAFLAYGSVLDNISGDATTMETQYLIELNGEAFDAIYPKTSGKPGIRRSVRK